MKSQAEIDKEKRLKTALGLANRAVRPGSESEGKAASNLLKKHMKQHQITDSDLIEYAKKESRGGRKSEQGRTSRGSTTSDGFYYRDQRDSRRAAEEAEAERLKKAEKERRARERAAAQEAAENKAEQMRLANEAYNERLDSKYGKHTTKTGWYPQYQVSGEKSTGEKIVRFIDGIFGL